jgi:hypothetical protein
MHCYCEQHVATLDFWACPAHLHQLPALLTTAIQQANEHGVEIMQVYIADCDEEKRRLAEAAGLTEAGRLRDRLRVGDRRHDLLVYEVRFSPKESLAHLPERYYGAGQPAITRGMKM